MVSQYEKIKMVAQAQILGRTSGAGPGPNQESDDNFSKSIIFFLLFNPIIAPTSSQFF